jgi:hypothetical protein
MTVQVLDLSQASNECITNSTVQITDGTYNETYSNACNYSGARNRPGTYTVTASAPGYRTTTISGIPIPADCNSSPTRLERAIRFFFEEKKDLSVEARVAKTKLKERCK